MSGRQQLENVVRSWSLTATLCDVEAIVEHSVIVAWPSERENNFGVVCLFGSLNNSGSGHVAEQMNRELGAVGEAGTIGAHKYG